MSDAERVFRVEVEQFDLAPGQVIALSGPSGSGKTMVLELLGLMREPGPGTRYFCDGQDLGALWASGGAVSETRGALFGFVPQTGGLLPFLTVAENTALPQHLAGQEDRGWCRDLLTRLGLADIAGLYPDALSIGQRQRVAIARALSHRPRFVIADEPTAALDPNSADQVLELLTGVVADLDCGLVLSSHDIARIDRLGVARRGFAVAPGQPVISRLLEEGAQC